MEYMKFNDVVLAKSASPEEPIEKKPYASPQLQELGDVGDVTLGGSPGVNDSGSADKLRKPPGT